MLYLNAPIIDGMLNWKLKCGGKSSVYSCYEVLRSYNGM
jgi:hypothetical protein